MSPYTTYITFLVQPDEAPEVIAKSGQACKFSQHELADFLDSAAARLREPKNSRLIDVIARLEARIARLEAKA